MKVLKILGVIVSLIFFLLYIIWPIGFGFFATLRIHRNVGNAPKGFSDLVLITSDNIKLSAWYAKSTNGATIILLHGSSSSREGIRSYANMLHKNGFGVLAFDLRGHGKSGGHGNLYGWECTKDVKAAVDYLNKQDGSTIIGGLGISLGGEILLSSLSSIQNLKAVVTDGATVHSIKDYLIISSYRNLIHSFTTRLMFASVKFFSRDEEPITILDSIIKSKNNNLFFIAAEKEKQEILYDKEFLKATNNEAQLWIAPNANHTEAFKLYPQEYESKIITFFKSKLLP